MSEIIHNGKKYNMELVDDMIDDYPKLMSERDELKEQLERYEKSGCGECPAGKVAEELSDNLARYSSGVEVEGYATARILELNQTLPDELICQRVKVLVMAGEE